MNKREELLKIFYPDYLIYIYKNGKYRSHNIIKKYYYGKDIQVNKIYLKELEITKVITYNHNYYSKYYLIANIINILAERKKKWKKENK